MNNLNTLKEAYTNPDQKTLSNLINYLDKISGKKLTESSIRQNILKTQWQDKEENLIARSHIQSAKTYLVHLKTDFEKTNLKTTIADLVDYVSLLDKEQDTSFILLSTNTLPSAIHFNIAEVLFHKHSIREQYKNNYGTDLLVIYALRLGLESRIRKLLGIDYAVSGGKKIGLSLLIDISKNLKNIEYSPEIIWAEIIWVNNWLNHHIHRLLRPNPWIIHDSIKILKPLLDPKEPVIRNGKKIYSFYSGSIVQNESKLRQEIFDKLQVKYPEIEIRWLVKREITRI